MELEEKIYKCKKCSLYKACKKPIAWDGNFEAKILIIWEAPWKEEDIHNKPFLWRSWKLLTKILEELWYYREKDYYITNIVKCRPPENRDPKPEEIKKCQNHLIEQINLMQPKLIITLWRFSFNFLIPWISISEWRWNFYKIDSKWIKKLKTESTILAIYHPAVALYSPSKKQIIIEDLAKINTFLN